LKSSTLQEVYGIRGNMAGEVIWHSLEKDGTIAAYDIKFGKKVIRGVPAALTETVMEQIHKHKSQKR